ncbi:hypothetical protein HMPREF9154_1895 [Arachnia propionica F0230a]|nr:hypothetical protein HMPREF9154_1895 [Arachnia propionica F0230a]
MPGQPLAGPASVFLRHFRNSAHHSRPEFWTRPGDPWRIIGSHETD